MAPALQRTNAKQTILVMGLPNDGAYNISKAPSNFGKTLGVQLILEAAKRSKLRKKSMIPARSNHANQESLQDAANKHRNEGLSSVSQLAQVENNTGDTRSFPETNADFQGGSLSPQRLHRGSKYPTIEVSWLQPPWKVWCWILEPCSDGRCGLTPKSPCSACSCRPGTKSTHLQSEGVAVGAHKFVGQNHMDPT